MVERKRYSLTYDCVNICAQKYEQKEKRILNSRKSRHGAVLSDKYYQNLAQILPCIFEIIFHEGSSPLELDLAEHFMEYQMNVNLKMILNYYS